VARLLDGRRALVTGASRGLGRAIAVHFAACGARVAFTYSSDDEGAAATLAAVRAAGTGPSNGGDVELGARAHRVSVLDVAGTAAMLKELDAAWGGVDVLVNNAGMSQNLPIALLEEDDWDLVMDTNVKGTYLTSRAVLRGMIRRKSGGVIINIGSLAGERGLDAPVHYSASKAAVRGLTQAMAKEVARHGVRVHCLAPGLLEDGAAASVPDYRLADYLEHCALGRVGTFDEVARLAAFLASERSSYMSGETIVVDGGV
jgi:NAD(P)-dependent dehydrogenase (short-subunit alcohol dehydrogenase family)